MVYLNKKIEFCSGSIRTQVYEMWAQGGKVACGVVTENTKVRLSVWAATVVRLTGMWMVMGLKVCVCIHKVMLYFVCIFFHLGLCVFIFKLC